MKAETLDHALKIFYWSINSLSEGRHPITNAFGKPFRGPRGPLAGPWRAAMCQVRGDWSFYKECFYFPQWNECERMCWLCRASSKIPHLAYTDHTWEAGWRDTLWEHHTYMDFLRYRGYPIPVLLREVKGLRLENIMIDVMHTVDLGITSHILGNVFFVLVIVRGVLGGRTYAERASLLGAHIKQWYSRTRTRVSAKLQGKVTLDRIRADGVWPKFRAKAAASRHLAKYALELVEQFMDGFDQDEGMHTVVRLLCRFIKS